MPDVDSELLIQNKHTTMTIIARDYVDASDLSGVQTLVQQTNALTGGYGLLHPGDIPHRVFNLLRMYDPAEILWLWEDEHGNLLGFVLVYPPFSGFDVLVHPAYRDAILETELLDWAEGQTWQWSQQRPGVTEAVGTDVLDGDLERIALLEQRGYATGGPAYMLTMRSLAGPIPGAELPTGFTLRAVAGDHEAGLLADVHGGAFGSNWTPDSYRQVMQSPGYDAERELVVVAPDGRFAAFCVIWFDEVNRTGLFEPVGAHRDFRRMGLTRALIAEGLRRMQAQGMVTAIVLHETDNVAGGQLYASAGFKPVRRIYHYRKPMNG